MISLKNLSLSSYIVNFNKKNIPRSKVEIKKLNKNIKLNYNNIIKNIDLKFKIFKNIFFVLNSLNLTYIKDYVVNYINFLKNSYFLIVYNLFVHKYIFRRPSKVYCIKRIVSIRRKVPYKRHIYIRGRYVRSIKMMAVKFLKKRKKFYRNTKLLFKFKSLNKKYREHIFNFLKYKNEIFLYYPRYASFLKKRKIFKKFSIFNYYYLFLNKSFFFRKTTLFRLYPKYRNFFISFYNTSFQKI